MEAGIQKAKATLRDQVLIRLGALSPTQRATAAITLCARLKQQEFWQSARSILFFAPLRNEPDIWLLLEESLAVGKITTLPRFSSASQTYVAGRLKNLQSDLHIGRFGIREPTEACEQVPPDQLDLVLVPGVAFDLHGRRLGRGKGFYDRLLEAVRGTKCGLAFDEQIVHEVPVGPQDVHLNRIVTPTRCVEIAN